MRSPLSHLKAEQLPQASLVREMLQSSQHLCCPPLDLVQELHVIYTYTVISQLYFPLTHTPHTACIAYFSYLLYVFLLFLTSNGGNVAPATVSTGKKQTPFL